jgi:sterol desaturase/sphingolipid hydroxylase (fatty acid hydroxylase superfamily)
MIYSYELVMSVCSILTYCGLIIYFTKKHQNNPFVSLPYNKTVPVVLFNLIILLPIVLFVCFGIYKYVSCAQDHLQIRLIISLYDIVMCIPILFLITIYVSIVHYLLHKIKFLYKTIHFLHHTAIITQPIDALYVHPLEFICMMILPVVVFPLILRINFPMTLIISLISMHENVAAHTSSARNISEHNFHHKLFTVNYDSYPYLMGKYVTNSYKNPKVYKDDDKKNGLIKYTYCIKIYSNTH